MYCISYTVYYSNLNIVYTDSIQVVPIKDCDIFLGQYSDVKQ